MNILFINHFFVGFIVSEIPKVSVFGYFPLLSVLFINTENNITRVDNYNNILLSSYMIYSLTFFVLIRNFYN